ncbi:MAG: 5-formyltetrahydrofolate cyclo-ligase [Nitrospirota bacterium]
MGVAKKDLRQRLLRRRASIRPDERVTAAAAVQRYVVDAVEWDGAATVMAYVASGSEVATELLLASVLAAGKKLVLPRVDEHGGLSLHAVQNLVDLVPGYRNILEPAPGLPRVVAGEVDLALIPGVGFDRRGGRLGYGGGFYDRLLAERGWRCPIWGLGFAVQIVDRIPLEGHDRRVSAVVTEAGLLHVHR